LTKSSKETIINIERGTTGRWLALEYDYEVTAGWEAGRLLLFIIDPDKEADNSDDN
jgi:hypothetical protein